MKKYLLLLSIIFFLSFTVIAQVSILASAIYLNVNGTMESFSTKNTLPPFAISNNIFTGSLGVFALNSGSLKIAGAEMNTNKLDGKSICGSAVYYIVYKQGDRPINPAFAKFELNLYCDCNGRVYAGCGSKPCNSVNDQKFQNVQEGIDLTGPGIGNYVLETFFEITGNDGNNYCNIIERDNNQNANYLVNFSITTPLAINLLALNGIAEENSIKIKWVVQNDADITKYNVQKSDNGLNFSSIYTVNSSRGVDKSMYLFSDPSPITGTNFYRIKSYNDNGTVNLSRVFRVYYGKVGNTLLIYPTPTANQLTVRFAAINKGSYQMSVLGTNGQKILSVPLQHDGIDKTLRFELPVTLSRTIYRLFLISKTQFYQQSFMVR